MRIAPDEPRPAARWDEGDGDVLWWCWSDGAWLGEAPYVGSPLDCGHAAELHADGCEVQRVFVGGWPGYHTHWTPLPPMPEAPPDSITRERPTDGS